MELSDADWAEVLEFYNGLLVVIRTVHQAAVENAVFHCKGMTKLVVDHLYKEFYVYL